jgi:hypothetical protein
LINNEEYFGGTRFLADGLLVMDGFDDCILGVVERFGQPPIVGYDKEKVLSRLMADDMTHEEALEFFEFNQIGAWVGDATPCFITVVVECKGEEGDQKPGEQTKQEKP